MYGILSTIIFLIMLPFWLIAGVFKPKLTVGFKEKCGFYASNVMLNLFQHRKSERQCGPETSSGQRSRTIAFYAISVGEVNAIENLIKKTRENFPQTNIILLTGTQTGQELAQKKFAKIVDFISYFPFDFPFCIKNMLKKLKPDAIFVMETELWPNFANITNKKKIPTFIINARISDRTYKSYKKLSFFFGPILKKYTAIYPQSEQDMKKLVSIGANPETTEIMGNLKFDIKKPDISNLDFETCENKIILAGSTHFGENEIILDVFDNLKKEIPDLKLIIAPRHPQNNENVFKLMKKTGYDCAKRSDFTPHPLPQGAREQLENPFVQNDVLLLDTMGELGKFYSVCDIAFIGGSFKAKGGDNNTKKGVGGHNPLEATIFNKPVFSGPSIHNFKDIYAILTSTNAGKVGSKEEMLEYFKKLLTDSEFYNQAANDCSKVFEQNQGALDFVLKVLQKLV